MEFNDMSLEKLFLLSSAAFDKMNTDGFQDESERMAAIRAAESAMERVYREGTFSKNETMDDTPTSDIKYRYLPFYYATLLQKCIEPSLRLESLQRAKEHFVEFIHTCASLHLLHEDDWNAMKNDEEVLSADRKRTQKIERYRRQKTSKERIQVLKRLLFITKEDSEIDHEDEVRELAITQLRVYATESIEEIAMIDQELKMLEHRNMLTAQAREAGRPLSPPDEPPRPGDGLGLSVVRLNKVGDQIMSSKDTVRAGMRAEVFKPRMSAPTMTLEEFADLELADARRREEREQQAVAEGGGEVRRYKQLEGDGEEDNDELVDQATVKDRDWDNWKDENPRGSGNKMGKRF